MFHNPDKLGQKLLLLLNKNNSLFIALAINKASKLLPIIPRNASLMQPQDLTRMVILNLNAN